MPKVVFAIPATIVVGTLLVTSALYAQTQSLKLELALERMKRNNHV